MQYPAMTMAIRRLAKRLETDKALASTRLKLQKMQTLTQNPNPYVSLDIAKPSRDMTG
jgi:hypothetical protein